MLYSLCLSLIWYELVLERWWCQLILKFIDHIFQCMTAKHLWNFGLHRILGVKLSKLLFDFRKRIGMFLKTVRPKYLENFLLFYLYFLIYHYILSVQYWLGTGPPSWLISLHSFLAMFQLWQWTQLISYDIFQLFLACLIISHLHHAGSLPEINVAVSVLPPQHLPHGHDAIWNQPWIWFGSACGTGFWMVTCCHITSRPVNVSIKMYFTSLNSLQPIFTHGVQRSSSLPTCFDS